MVASQAELSGVDGWSLAQADLRHETVGGHCVDGMLMAIGAVVVAKPVVSCGGYWLILGFVVLAVLAVARLTIASGGWSGSSAVLASARSSGSVSLSSRRRHRTCLLKPKDISGELIDKRLKAGNTLVECVVRLAGGVYMVVAVGAMLAGVVFMQAMVANAARAEGVFLLAVTWAMIGVTWLVTDDR
jgi:hypothetical protein